MCFRGRHASVSLVGNALGKDLTDVRGYGVFWLLWLDGKTQKMLAHGQRADGLVHLRRFLRLHMAKGGRLGVAFSAHSAFFRHSISWSAGVGGQCTGTVPICQLVPELVTRHLPLKDAVKTTATTKPFST